MKIKEAIQILKDHNNGEIVNPTDLKEAMIEIIKESEKPIFVARSEPEVKEWSPTEKIFLTVVILLLIFLGGIFVKGQAQSKEEVLDYINFLGIKHPEIVLNQAILESGNFGSDIYKENHNLFGMKEAKARTTTALGTNRNHAYYTNWKASVIDYCLYQRRYYKGGDYYQFLESKGYATSKKYIKKLKQF